MSIEVTINGKKEKIEEGTTITEVLEKREIRPEMVAVEVNGEVVDKEDYSSLKLKSGDEIEFLYYMAGGKGAEGSRLKANLEMGNSKDAVKDKFEHLGEIISRMKKVIVAYSGGVDSTLLLKVSLDILGKGEVLAATADSKTYPSEELELAKERAKNLGAKHWVIETEEVTDPRFTSNPPDRCYYCKKELFSKLRNIAQQEKFDVIVDGSNCDDETDFRPGRKAALEFCVRSPLREASLTKKDVREISRTLNLPTWNKPSLACLSSRFPYGTRITEESLARVYKAEKFLHSLGLEEVRVRHHSEIARIEVGEKDLSKFFENGVKEGVARRLKELGYIYITLDLEGYRSGSLNSLVIKR